LIESGLRFDFLLVFILLPYFNSSRLIFESLDIRNHGSSPGDLATSVNTSHNACLDT
jgi:hypothetical protein